MSVRTSIKHLQCHQSPIRVLTRSLSWLLSTPPPSPKPPPSKQNRTRSLSKTQSKSALLCGSRHSLPHPPSPSLTSPVSSPNSSFGY
ncbi:hypothetical protein FF2_036988 [Malus domestica]